MRIEEEAEPDMARFERKIDILRIAELHEASSTSRGIASELDPLTAELRDNGAVAQLYFSSRSAVHGTLACTRIGYRWMKNLAALCFYGIFVMPGVLQVAWRYFTDTRIYRNIAYGQHHRNKLDLYLPHNLETPRSVVVFITGGAWIIGYKAWGSILAFQLVEEDVIVVCMDYRNFPQGTISDMMEDVSEGISYVFKNIVKFGGDLDRLYLVGQSAGAHLGACALLEQVRKEVEESIVDSSSSLICGEDEALLSWRASQFKAYIGISGGYDLYRLADYFDKRGMHRSLFLRIMEGKESLARYSPELYVQNFAMGVGSLIPPIYLLHGKDDRSIPCKYSTSFVEALKSAGVQATTLLYEGKTHTDLFIQDPMRGGRDALLEDILEVLNLSEAKNEPSRLHRRMVPDCLLWLAHRVSPF